MKSVAVPYIDLSAGFSAYCRARKAAGSETIEKTLQKQRVGRD